MPQQFQFGDFSLNLSRYQLHEGDRRVRLEQIPMELLILLLERKGELVSRQEIAQRLWGKEVFVDVEHGINTAVRKVRRVLRDDPEKPRFVETVVGRGYRFAAPVIVNNDGPGTRAESLPSGEGAGPAAAAPTQPKSAHKKRLMPAWGLVTALSAVTLTVVLLLVGRNEVSRAAPPASECLAVLPLENLSGDPSQEYFADGMTEAIIGRLAMIHGLRVISRTSVMRLKNTHMSLPEIGKMLHADAIVEGSIVRAGNRVRIHAQLIRAATDEHFWSESYDSDLSDVLALQSQVAQAIAQKVEVTLTGQEQARLIATRRVSPKVYEDYLRGQYSKGDSKAAVEERIVHFQDAIREDPTFAPAYVGLAAAYDDLGLVYVGGPPDPARAEVLKAAGKALALDPQLADAHDLLADVYQERWQWADAEREIKTALELAPNDADAHLAFSNWLLCQGRTQEAVTWAERARELDPLGVTGADTASLLFNGRRYDEALAQARSVPAVHPSYAVAQWVLGFVLIADNRPQEAITPLQNSLRLTGGSPGVMGVLVSAYAHAGRRADALRVLGELKARQKKGYVPAAAFVNAYLGLGDREQAFAWLEQAYREQSNILQFLKVHPFFDPLRNDPRFADLLHRVGLDQDVAVNAPLPSNESRALRKSSKGLATAP